jgi:hexosaminidase
VIWLVGRASNPRKTAAGTFPNVVIPAPVSAIASGGKPFLLNGKTTIVSDSPTVADYLTGILRKSTGYPLGAAESAESGAIVLTLHGAPASVGDDGYQMTVSDREVAINANTPAGLFAGVQTLLQLLPPAVMAPDKQTAKWSVPSGTIVDYPRFAYRGAMLDVARHFFTVDQVKRYIDEIALYKINYLHLHLSDDQGWRIAIKQWPNLTQHGGSTQVDGTPAGYYTQADYSAIVAYAASRFITVVPEIDMPGHTNAALASYAELNCDGKAPDLYTGVNVGFSSLCTSKEITYKFIDDVIGELAVLTPGPYIHIGGDESQATKPEDYVAFVERAQEVVRAHGKTAMGWHEVTEAKLQPSTIAQFWATNPSGTRIANAASQGTKVVLSPASLAYIDQKYNDGTELGATWAGEIELNTAYGWDPGSYLPGVDEKSVLGVEACLWTETIRNSADIEYMAFPRLPAIAELGWSPASTHNVRAFDARVAAQGPRWKIMGVNYYRSPQVVWPDFS